MLASRDAVTALTALAALPGVAEGTDEARAACTRLRWHQALRRRSGAAAAESRVRGARASAALDGAEVPLDVVRDMVRGALPWSDEGDAVRAVLRGACRATSESEHVQSLVAVAPSQALARLHTAAAAGLLPPRHVGRPRQAGEVVDELADVGPAPESSVLPARLRLLADVLGSIGEGPGLVVAAVAHGEVVTMRPFVRGNGLVARALERAVIVASGLDPTGVVVPEVGHGRGGTAAYLGALTAYGTGTSKGVALWLRHCAAAVVEGAAEGGRIADAVLAGRLR